MQMYLSRVLLFINNFSANYNANLNHNHILLENFDNNIICDFLYLLKIKYNNFIFPYIWCVDMVKIKNEYKLIEVNFINIGLSKGNYPESLFDKIIEKIINEIHGKN